MIKQVYVAGHRGMVGSAIVRQLQAKGGYKIIVRTHAELDLTSQAAVADFFESNDIDQVYLAAAKVGGIHANNEYPAEFIYENLVMESNVIHQAFMSGVKQLLFLGSSCIYPKLADQPMSEEALLTGTLEPTNEPYAIAKIAGIKDWDYITRFDEKSFTGVQSFYKVFYSTPLGKKVNVELIREGKLLTLSVQLFEKPEPKQ